MANETAKVWEEFGNALRRFILKRIGDADAAEDILQDTFVKIHKNIGKLEDEKRLQAWLYRITRNTVIDYYRSRKPTEELPELPQDVDSQHDSDGVAASDLAPCVRALMERLPEKYREPLVSTEFDGLTQKEMGEKLGLSESGAKSRYQRGKEKLRCLLLECCDFELDRRGNIQDYSPKSPSSPDCCTKRSCD